MKAISEQQQGAAAAALLHERLTGAGLLEDLFSRVLATMPSPVQEAHAGDPRLVPMLRATAAQYVMEYACARLAVNARPLFTRRLLGLVRLTDEHAWRRFTEGILDYAEDLSQHPATRADITAYINDRGHAVDAFCTTYPAEARPVLEDASLQIERLVGEVLKDLQETPAARAQLPETGLVARDEATGRHEHEGEAGRRIETDISDTIADVADREQSLSAHRERPLITQLPVERDTAGEQHMITRVVTRHQEAPLFKKRPQKRAPPLPAQTGGAAPRDADEVAGPATSDGGATWSAQISGSGVGLGDVTFTDAAHGWAVGNGGTILATSDGGATWSAQSSGSSADLRAVTFSDVAHGWAVGADGAILAITSSDALP